MLDESLRFDEGNADLVADLEAAFGDWIWQEGQNFQPNDIHLKSMFRIANKHVFGNQLDQNVRKFVKPESECQGAERMAMAGYSFGWKRGEENEYIEVIRHDAKDNFFIVMNSLIHEMIHMFDFHFGPMGKQFQKWNAVGTFNWNYQFPLLPVPGYTPPARYGHLSMNKMEPDQLPDELRRDLDKPARIEALARPRQYQYPADVDTIQTLNGPEEIPVAKKGYKYRMGQLDGFYDVHGGFFQQLADRANGLGFAIDDVFHPDRTYKFRRLDEDPDETPEDLRYMTGEAFVERVFSRIKDPGKFLDYEDPENWSITLV